MKSCTVEIVVSNIHVDELDGVCKIQIKKLEESPRISHVAKLVLLEVLTVLHPHGIAFVVYRFGLFFHSATTSRLIAFSKSLSNMCEADCCWTVAYYSLCLLTLIIFNVFQQLLKCIVLHQCRLLLSAKRHQIEPEVKAKNFQNLPDRLSTSVQSQVATSLQQLVCTLRQLLSSKKLLQLLTS